MLDAVKIKWQNAHGYWAGPDWIMVLAGDDAAGVRRKAAIGRPSLQDISILSRATIPESVRLSGHSRSLFYEAIRGEGRDLSAEQVVAKMTDLLLSAQVADKEREDDARGGERAMIDATAALLELGVTPVVHVVTQREPDPESQNYRDDPTVTTAVVGVFASREAAMHAIDERKNLILSADPDAKFLLPGDEQNGANGDIGDVIDVELVITETPVQG